MTGSRRNVPQRARGRRRGPWFGEDARVRRGRRRPFRARGCRRRCRGAARMCRRRPARPPGTDGHDNARSLGARRQIAGVADAGVFTMVERVFTMGWNRCSRWAGARSLDRGPARAQGRTRARRARPRHARSVAGCPARGGYLARVLADARHDRSAAHVLARFRAERASGRDRGARILPRLGPSCGFRQGAIGLRLADAPSPSRGTTRTRRCARRQRGPFRAISESAG